jgi:hypothetical protein
MRCLAAAVAQFGGAGGLADAREGQSGCGIATRRVLARRTCGLHFSNSPAVSGSEHRHCERSEAIHSFFARCDGLLRFARNDGVIYFRDLAAGFARGFAISFGPPRSEGAGNAGRPMRPIAACAMSVVERTRVSQVTPGNTRHSPRDGFTAYFALSPVIGSLSPSLANMACRTRSGAQDLRQLDASTEASGPHDFAVRGRPRQGLSTGVVPIRRSPGEGVFGIGRLRAVRSLTGKARPAITRAPDAAASTAPPPNVRDDRDTPLCAGRDGGSYKTDLGVRKTRIFLQKGLDRGASDLPVGCGWRELRRSFFQACAKRRIPE